MNSKFFSDIKKLPSNGGVFKLCNKKKDCLFIGIAENIKREVELVFTNKPYLKSETSRIEIFETATRDLIEIYSSQIRLSNPLYNFSIQKQNLYPHIKITNEKFPRLLATRRIKDDAAEYFGAFLPDTKVRFLLGFLINTFRLRGCDIPIDGNLPAPCPQYYRRKCLAPCVENLCDKESYSEAVNLARLFLQNKRDELNEIVSGKINIFSELLDFEAATKWRDFRQTINDFGNNKNRQFRVEDAVDSFDLTILESKVLVNLITRRNRKILGSRIFVFEKKADFTAAEILEQLLWQFYQFHTPKEISVSIDFPSRKFLEKTLSFGASKIVKVIVCKTSNQKKTVNKALRRSKFEYELENLKPEPSADEIQNEIQNEFSLIKKPYRIEAFDVAHISGADFVGAKSVWEGGKFKPEEYEFWFLDEKNELAAMAKTLENRFKKKERLPEMILIDGGRSQMLAALKSINKLNDLQILVISAVKPPQKHNEISHFLTQSGRKIQYKKNSDGFNVLLKLRDETHELANYVHRTKRETVHFYELFQITSFLSAKERYLLLRHFGSLKELRKTVEADLIKILGEEKGKLIYLKLKEDFSKAEPFIVAIRYDDPNGEAEDLRPIFML
ncbi:MAG: excinuclease ABC subunit UvrC [Acidobacteriota bacterium]|nr:excinuclease ABC subunit UvrC [Acidobacteriota bacterium]